MKPHLLTSPEPLLALGGDLRALCGKFVEDAQMIESEFMSGTGWLDNLNSLSACKNCVQALIWDENGEALIERIPFYVYTIAPRKVVKE